MCLLVWMYLSVSLDVCVSQSGCMYLSVWMYVSLFMWMYVSVSLDACVRLDVCVLVRVGVCVY